MIFILNDESKNMKTILLINDDSTAVSVAAKMALQIARAMEARILIVPTYHEAKTPAAKVLAGDRSRSTGASAAETDGLLNSLLQLNERSGGFRPSIALAGFSATDAGALAELSLKTECWLIIRGCGQMPPGQLPINFQSLLNRLRCPLLLVPEHWTGEPIRRITYLADLRYCRLNIMHYLAQWAASCQASLSLAHFSKEGLVPIVEDYGLDLFAGIARQLTPCSLSFNNIRDSDIHRALDILIHGLHTDLLVLINHRFHFKKIIGDHLTDQLPEGLAIPLLLFPM